MFFLVRVPHRNTLQFVHESPKEPVRGVGLAPGSRKVHQTLYVGFVTSEHVKKFWFPTQIFCERFFIDIIKSQFGNESPLT